MHAYPLLLRSLPTSLGLNLVRRLAQRTQRAAIHADQRAAMLGASRIPYGNGNVAWSWGEGPLVLLIHGWNGRAAQLAPLATKLANNGYRAVCIEVTGHGESAGTTTAWHFFIDDLVALVKTLGGRTFALIGHSAGGLTMMAARQLRDLRAERYVCICAPSHPFPPVRAVRQNLNPPQRVIEAYEHFIAKQFDTTWDRLHEGQAFLDLQGELLLFYDRKDRFVDHTEGDRILSWCPGARLIKTADYGHTRVLSAPELHHDVVQFLQMPSVVANRK